MTNLREKASFLKKIARFIFRLIHHKHPFRYFFAIFLRYTRLSSFIYFENQGIKFRFFPTSFSQTLWTFAPHFNDEEMVFFNHYLKQDQIIIDVGANIGNLTLLAAKKIGVNGKVIAFEPTKEIFEALDFNIKLNKLNNCEIHCTALGAVKETKYWESKRADEQNKIAQKQTNKILNINILDDYTTHLDTIDLLKIDVEGYEYFVLQGANKTLSKTKCIYFEAKESFANAYGYSIKDIFDFLEKRNFKFFMLNEKIEWIPITNEFLPEKCVNIIAIH